MVLFFTITLLISIFGLVSLFSLKSWELQTGKMAFSSIRPALGDFFRAVLFWVERVLPTLARVWARRTARAAGIYTYRALAWAVLKIEYSLERTLTVLRGATSTHRSAGEASAFLRAVAEHKRTLLRQPKVRRAIKEE